MRSGSYVKMSIFTAFAVTQPQKYHCNCKNNGSKNCRIERKG